jgi:hypothetical protein
LTIEGRQSPSSRNSERRLSRYQSAINTVRPDFEAALIGGRPKRAYPEEITINGEKRMRGTTRVIMLCAVLAGISVGITGCKKATGGGTLTASQSGGKVNLGFQMRCDNVGDSGYLTGQFQWKDRGADVAVHGVIDAPLLPILGALTCEGLGELLEQQGITGIFGDLGTFGIGTYTPHPKNLGEGGDLSVTVFDAESLLGCNGVRITLSGGVHGAYSEAACLDNGNITVFSE